MANKGLLILNLGSPDSFAVADVAKYLRQFLMDERVIDSSWIVRKMLVEAIIVPFRAPKSAEAYSSIWDDRGSPLKVITEDFKTMVESATGMPSAVAMRYGNPTQQEALKLLEEKTGKLDEILLAPMYPHYAMSSYETAVEQAKSAIKEFRADIRIKILKPFYNEPAYISSLAESIRPYLRKRAFDTYLFSYHGLPIRHLKKTDPTKTHCYASNDCCEIRSAAWDLCYKHQVKETTKLVAAKLGLEEAKVKITFQSRLGSGWLQPFTDVVLQELPKEGKKKILVICPAFVADCLETLEEIHLRGKESFMSSGGEEFVAVPCLNTNADWVNAFAGYCIGNEGKYAHLWK